MFIAPHAKALRHADRLVQWRGGQTPAPVTVEWDLTNVCSLGCQSCHFAHTHEAGPWARHAERPDAYTSTGRHADARLVSHALVDMATAGVRGIVWSGGGEPTLHPSFGALVTRAHEAGLEQGLYTHGGHIDDALAQTLAGRLTWAVVSLDAVDAATYAAEKRVPAQRFDAACEGVRRLSRAGITVGVSFLLHGRNWPAMADMVALSRSLGATYTTFRPTIETSPQQPGVCQRDRSWITDALPLLSAVSAWPDVELDVSRFLAYRDWRGHGYTACHGITLNTTITPDGRVWVCPQRRGLAGSELGDLRTESFTDLWSRHPGHWTVDASCRVMCRLHTVNQAVAPVFAAQMHEAFV
jgi:MoaA/NifB/PqqE/SkfB family radical SAM enzyme